MKRRKFLQTTSAASLPLMIKGVPVSSMSKSALFRGISDDSDRVLVIIQLFGGNDGLQTLLPLDQYHNLVSARQNLIIPESSAIQLDETIGMHPVMTGMKGLWDDGKLGIVQSVGYPNHNRSHFRSTDIWTTGSPADEVWTTGWLGRYFQQDHSEFPTNYPNNEYEDPFAITIGTQTSETCQGTIANFSMAITNPFNLGSLATGGEDDVPDTPYGDQITFLRTAISQTNAYSGVISEAADKGNNLSTLYPESGENRLADYLKTIALLISGGLKTKVYVATLGGFDTHNAQVVASDTTTGLHATLLQTVSDAITAFQDDLKKLGLEERVLGMTFSEFGRRIKANDSLGTDHGTSAPLFLFGSCVNPGILGENPVIPEEVSVTESVAMQYDFRSVYGTILEEWFEVPEQEVRDLLFDDYQLLPILNPCSSNKGRSFERSLEPEYIEASTFPNPCNGYCHLDFESKGEWTRISVFDADGYEVRVLSDRQFDKGQHRVTLDSHDLPKGNYYFRILTKQGQATRAFVKAK